MDKKKKSKIIVALIVLVQVILLTVCIGFWLKHRASLDPIAKAENVFEENYHAYCTYEHAADIDINGSLDEACWKDKNWFSNVMLNYTGKNEVPSFKMTSYIDEYGIYIAAIAEDTNIVCDGQRDFLTNSNFELFVEAMNIGETLVDDRIDTEVWNIDMRGDVNSRYSNVDRAVVVDGEINSGDTKSATLEMFIPWETMDIDKTKGIPKEFYCMPGYFAFLPGQTTRTRVEPVLYPSSDDRDYYVFDTNGYTMVDREGAVVGDTCFGQAKTANWDISKESEGIVQSSIGTEHHKIFFKEAYGKNFIVETTIVPVCDIENSGPKAGLYFQSLTGNGAYYNAIFLDMHENMLVDGINGTRNFGKLKLVSLHNNDGKWTQTALSQDAVENPNALKKEGVKMTVIKYDAMYWVFLDGKFATTLDLSFMDMEVVPGFYSLGANAIYKDYSCEEIDEESLMEYINKKNLYMIDAQVESAGGEVTTSEFTVASGGSYDIEILTNSGYQVSSVIINGKEKLSDVKKNAVGGVYTVTGVKSNQEVRVSFEKCKGYTFTGNVKSGDTYLTAEVTLEGVTNKSLKYQATSVNDKGFSVDLPSGTYQITITSEGYVTVVDTIKISKNTSKTFKASLSQFATQVDINGKKLNSVVKAWDLKNEYQGKVTTSYADGGKTAPLYFKTVASDFVVQAQIDYTTVFKAGETYQPDLMGGFIFNDGTNSGWIVSRRTGFTYTDWKQINGLLDYEVLAYPGKRTVNFAIAKKGDTVYAYLDGGLVATYKWSMIAPKIDSKSKVAIGLFMVADKTADIQFSNYSLKTGVDAVDNFMKNTVVKNELVQGTNLFAKTYTINNKKRVSAIDKWDLSDVSKGIVRSSYEMGGKTSPLYFNASGSSLLVETTIKYTTEFKDGVSYQPDLMGGFYLTDGTHTGWVVANRTGLAFTGWNKNQDLVNDSVLEYPTARPVKMTMAVKDNMIYIYFDEALIWKQKLGVVVKDVGSNANLAVALYMVADKPADIEFSDISISTDKDVVSNYIKTHK